MGYDLKLGVSRQVECIIGEEHAATHIGGGRVPVFSTPAMINLMEVTATDAVQPFLPANHTTVGIHVDVHHLAATPLGMKVTVRAELVEVDKRLLTFRVTAEDETELIGEGTHRRAIIDVARLQEKLAKKRERR
jgi:predicted thioesterase